MSNQSPLTLANLQERFRRMLREENFFTNILANVEAKTKVNREYIAYGKCISSLFVKRKICYDQIASLIFSHYD
jgi:hypothetical protein